MTRGCSILLTALLLMAPTGCKDKPAQDQRISAAEEAQLAVRAQAGDAEAAKQLEQIQKMRAAMPPDDQEVTPDNLDGWRWPAEEVAALTKRAEAGDMKAADTLAQYYAVHENVVKRAYWEDWLFRHGDPGAISDRALTLYMASEKRAPSDPRKLAELKEAERLKKSVTPDDQENVFLQKIRSDIAALEAAQ